MNPLRNLQAVNATMTTEQYNALLTQDQKEARDLYYKKGALAFVTPEMKKIIGEYKKYRLDTQVKNFRNKKVIRSIKELKIVDGIKP